jgi:hypothetical protein
MSSFVGHGLVAAANGVARRGSVPERRAHIAWVAWLVVVAWFPDIDYAVPGLRPGAHVARRIRQVSRIHGWRRRLRARRSS